MYRKKSIISLESIQMGFNAGYGIAGMSFVQLFFVCELGENIQVWNDLNQMK